MKKQEGPLKSIDIRVTDLDNGYLIEFESEDTDPVRASVPSIRRLKAKLRALLDEVDPPAPRKPKQPTVGAE